MDINSLSEQIIGAAIDIHRTLGPGLLESAYPQCLCYELSQRGIKFEIERPLPVIYKGIRLDCGYRIDILVENQIVVELKSVETIFLIVDAQLLTYLRLGHWKLGLVVNFNVPILKDGIRGKVNKL